MYAFALALLSAILFGASTPASKALLASLDPLQLAGLLYLGAAIGMAPVAAAERHTSAAHVDRASFVRLAGAVLFGGILAPVLLLAALRVTYAGSVSLLLNLEAVATAVLGVVLFREHLGRAGWIGVGGALAASALLAAGSGWPGFAAAGITAAACLCWALDNHLTALIDGITAPRIVLVKGVVAGATNLSIGVAAASFVATPETVAIALGVGALSYGVSIALYIRASHEIGAIRAQAVFASAPFVGAALSVAVLHEPRGGITRLYAIALLVPSIAALFWSRHAHPHVHQAGEHTHSHRHDDPHHLHVHPGSPPSLRHSHAHRHDRIEHAHPHWSDLHHRHEHE